MSVDDIAGNTAIYKIDPFPQELKPRILPGSADSLLCRTQTPDGRFWCIYSFKRINDNLLFRASQHILSNCTCREALDFMDDQSEIVFTAEESLKMQQIVTKKLAPYRPNQT
jgi:hypothetical protein